MIKTGKELAAAAEAVAKNYKTLYVMGCFGAPLNAKNKTRYTQNHTYNKQPARTAKIKAASADTFGFDCVCLIKGLLWGWSGDTSKNYGGAAYGANSVPDIGADSMIKVCRDVSTDFSKIEVGEAVWMDGHIGIYIGNGLAVESTPKWADCVQITACNNTRSGYNRRNWTKHGKLPYVSYTGAAEDVKTAGTATKTLDELAREVLDGKWGNGSDRKNRLTAAGYDAAAVQAKVNALCAAKPEPWIPKVGDVVNYTGKVHYSNSGALIGKSCKPGKAKITAIYRLGKSRHPYQLVRISGAGSTVNGWVNAGTFTKA
jgi:hypothetical protein